LDGEGWPGLATKISADTGTAAPAGSVLVETPVLTARNGSVVSSLSSSSGGAGSVVVHAERIALYEGSAITSIPLGGGSGAGGSVTVTASESILVDGLFPQDENVNSFIGNVTGGSGSSGEVFVSAPQITLSNRGAISSSTVSTGN